MQLFVESLFPSHKQLEAAAKSLGIACVPILVPPHQIKFTDCDWYNGSIQTYHELVRLGYKDPTGGLSNYDCTAYIPHFLSYLTNRNFGMWPLGAVPELKWRIFGQYARDTKIFIRPNAGTKSFTGFCLDLQDFDIEWQNRLSKFDPSLLVLVSTPVDILGEWRYIIADQSIIAVSSYIYQGNRTEVPGAPQELTGFVKMVMRSVAWKPSKIFVVDAIVTTGGDMSILELNAFPTADLYHCDKVAIIKQLQEFNAARK